MPLKDLQVTPVHIAKPSGLSLSGSGSQPIIFALTVLDDVTANLDWTLPPFPMQLVDMHAVKTVATAAASANTVQAQTVAAAPVTDALNMQVAVGVLVRLATIDDATQGFTPSAVLRIRRFKAGQDASCIVYVKMLRLG